MAVVDMDIVPAQQTTKASQITVDVSMSVLFPILSGIPTVMFSIRHHYPFPNLALLTISCTESRENRVSV